MSQPRGLCFRQAIDPRPAQTLEYAASKSAPQVTPMAVPKRRQSNQKTRSRRAHDFLTPRQLTFCSNCGKAVPTHRICGNCGHYMGRAVIKSEE